MGNGNSDSAAHPSSFKDFPMQKYISQGARQQQIIKIKQAFDSYHPVDGYIEVSKLRSSTGQSGSKDLINKHLGNKERLNFDEFFQMSRELVDQQIRKNPSLIIDTSQVQATCLFCPYATDKPVS